MREVYLDNAAATPVHPYVLRAMVRAAREAGNPSSFNEAGRRARALLDDARGQVAEFLSAAPREIVFCASGSEANTLAIHGSLAAAEGRAHVVVSAIEHPSVLEAVRASGARMTVVQPDQEGRVSADAVLEAIRPNTVLVSIMYANNEVGSIQPIKQIAKAVRQYRRTWKASHPYLHTDACQATAWLPMDVQALGVDLLTLNGAKVHGPRGIATLYVRRNVTLQPQVYGGTQELGRRAGTEDVPGAVGLARALRQVKHANVERVTKMRDAFGAAILAALPDIRMNSPQSGDRLPNIISLSVPDCTSEELLLELDHSDIRAGAGSACTAHRVEPSHVLVAMQVPERYLPGTLRFSLSRGTTHTEMNRLAEVLPQAVARVRARRTS